MRRNRSRRAQFSIRVAVGAAMLLVATAQTRCQTEPRAHAARLVGLLDLERHREIAIEELVEIGPPAVDPLCAALIDERAAVRTAAVRALAQIRGADDRVLTALLASFPAAEGAEADACLAYFERHRDDRRVAAAMRARAATATRQPVYLITDYSDNAILAIDEDGETVFEIEEQYGVWDAEWLTNGNLLVVQFALGRVAELTPEGRTVWSFDGLRNPYDADRLPSGNTLIADTYANRIVEVDPAGEVVQEIEDVVKPIDVQRLPDGKTLVADGKADRIVELDETGKVVWELEGWSRVWDVDRLANGNTLVTQRRPARIVEVDRSGRVVAEFDSKSMKSPSDADRLENGNTLVACDGAVLLLDPAGDVVWRHDVSWAVEVEVRPTN